jgi:hypothetical protein
MSIKSPLASLVDGDNWRVNVQLERIEPSGRKLKTPRIVESKGKSPEQYPVWDK